MNVDKAYGKTWQFRFSVERPHTPLVERPARTAAASGAGTVIDGKRSQSTSSGTLPVERHDLHRRMAEVLALREKVTSLAKVGKESALKASTPASTGWQPKLAL